MHAAPTLECATERLSPSLTSLDPSRDVMSIELMERQLRRSVSANVARSYRSHPLYYPLGLPFDEGVVVLDVEVVESVDTIMNKSLTLGKPTLTITIQDSADGVNWTTIDGADNPKVLSEMTSADDGLYRIEIPTPFGAFLRVNLDVEGGPKFSGVGNGIGAVYSQMRAVLRREGQQTCSCGAQGGGCECSGGSGRGSQGLGSGGGR